MTVLLVLYLPRLTPTGRFLREESTQGLADGFLKQAAHGRSPEHFLRVWHQDCKRQVNTQKVVLNQPA